MGQNHYIPLICHWAYLQIGGFSKFSKKSSKYLV